MPETGTKWKQNPDFAQAPSVERVYAGWPMVPIHVVVNIYDCSRFWKSLRLRIHLIKFNQFSTLNWPLLFFICIFFLFDELALISFCFQFSQHGLSIQGSDKRCWTIGIREERKPIQLWDLLPAGIYLLWLVCCYSLFPTFSSISKYESSILYLSPIAYACFSK